MLSKMNANSNAINWFDIPVTDLQRAKEFYETIFEIQMETGGPPQEQMAFFPRKKDTIMGLSGILSGALVNKKEFNPGTDGPLIYLNASPELDPVINRLQKAGGKVLVNKTKIPAGYIAICLDSEGNRIGLHAPQ